ncbi:MAG: glycosyltransferase family 2 protein [Rhodospirillales bacterium]
MTAAGAALDIAVIIPAYKAGATITRALMSIAAQTAAPREVLVVVDGLFDDTAEKAEACRGALAPAKLTVITQDNAGAGAARNRALKEATTAWLAFLDADDEWLPEKLAHSMAWATEGGLTLLAHDCLYAFANGREELSEPSRRFREAAADPYAGLYRKGFILTSTVLVRRDAVLAAGGFDESLPTAQDFDLWLKVLAPNEARFEVHTQALTRYHVTEGSITAHTGRRLDCTLRVARRHRETLSKRGATAKSAYLYRIAAVHFEAITAHRKAGRWFAALTTAIKGGVRWIGAAFGA